MRDGYWLLIMLHLIKKYMKDLAGVAQQGVDYAIQNIEQHAN